VKRAFLAVAFVLGSIGAGSRDARAALEEREVVETALATHPTGKVAASTADAAAAEARASQMARLPDLTLSARYTRTSSLPERFRTLVFPTGDSFAIPQLLDGYALRAALVVPVSDAWLRLAAVADAAGKVADARALELRTARCQLGYDARVAYLMWARTRLQLDRARSAASNAAAQATDQRERAAAGVVAPTQVLAFEAAKESMELEVRTLEQELVAREAVLLSYGPTLRLVVPADVADPPTRVPAPPPLPPAIAALVAAADAADARVRAEAFSLLPRLDLVLGAEVSAPNPRAFAVSTLAPVPSWDITVALTWNSSALYVQTNALGRARAERDGAQARVEEERRRLAAERTAAAGALSLSAERVRQARAREERALTLAVARRRELEVGTAVATDVILAEGELLRARADVVDARVEARLAVARLDLVDGRELPGAW
jgi:outer membrane protein TolC